MNPRNINNNISILICNFLVSFFAFFRKRPSFLLLSSFIVFCYFALPSFRFSKESPRQLPKIVKLQHCNCTRKIVPSTDKSHHISYKETTCSRDAFQRGPGQKVVSYSYYGKARRSRGYFDGIAANLKLMHKFYPGWTMRVYMELELGDPLLDELCHMACKDPILDLCHAGNLPGTPRADARKMFPMIWRFLPTLDPQVDVYNCRDLDSRIGERELAAVDEWLKIGAPVHAMRDNPAHGAVMVGASWGADLRRKGSREKWKRSWENILKDEICWSPRGRKRSYGADQYMLRRHVWRPWAVRESVQHDSYLCRVYPGSIPWPVERRKEPYNFVGSLDNMTLWQVCPEECRPREHPEWEHC